MTDGSPNDQSQHVNVNIWANQDATLPDQLEFEFMLEVTPYEDNASIDLEDGDKIV